MKKLLQNLRVFPLPEPDIMASDVGKDPKENAVFKHLKAKKLIAGFLLFSVTLVFSQQYYKMNVANVTSLQPAQLSYEAPFSADNNIGTLYHSKFGFVNAIPDQLNFEFSSKVKSIKRLVYNPRTSGYNGIWTQISVSYSTRTNPSVFTQILGPTSLASNNTAKVLELPSSIQDPAVVRVDVLSAVGNFSSCAEMEFYSLEQMPPVQTECILPANDLVNYDKVQPVGSSASSAENGSGINLTTDNNNSTIYHSQWSGSGTAFPVVLTYSFNGQTPIDYLLYTPRQDGNENGYFGNVKISYNTSSNSNYVQIAALDFGQDAGLEKVDFPSTITPLNIKIEVYDGKNNFASCAEMGFYTKKAANFSPFAESVKIYPSTSGNSASNAQNGYGIDLTIDNNTSTLYHSSWSPTATTFPVSLVYRFNGQTSMNQLRYTPRQDGSVNGFFGNVKISYNTASNPNYVPLLTQNFGQDGTVKTVDFPVTITPLNIKIEVLDGKNNFASCGEMEFFKTNSDPGTPVYPQVSEASASSVQSGYPVSNSLDGNLSSIYHSQWSPGATSFPVTLVYKFSGQARVDYLKYIPRQDGNENGNFGNVKISYNTSSNSTYTQLLTYNFGQDGMTKTITFPSSITPLNIKIEVLDGKNNFASCAEMQFFTKNTMSVFKDDLFSELKSTVTQADINSVSSPFLKGLAQCLYNNTYNKKYRVKTYYPYKKLETISSQYKIATYNNFENPTGIVFQANTTVVIFAKDISAANKVYLRVTDFADESTWTDKQYELENGLNILQISNNGLGYISYFTDDPLAKPVSLNITGGIVNGIYDRNTLSQEWKDILTNDVYPKVDIEGYYAKLVMDKFAVKTYHYDSAQALIDKYDAMVKAQREVMGFYKYNINFKNRQFAYTESKGGWYAGGLGAHFDLTWGTAQLASANNLSYWGLLMNSGIPIR